MVGEEANALHLVKHRVVAGVYLVPPVNVSGHQEGVQTTPHQLPLVGGGVSAEHGFPAMVWRSEQLRWLSVIVVVGEVTHLFR